LAGLLPRSKAITVRSPRWLQTKEKPWTQFRNRLTEIQGFAARSKELKNAWKNIRDCRINAGAWSEPMRCGIYAELPVWKPAFTSSC